MNFKGLTTLLVFIFTFPISSIYCQEGNFILGVESSVGIADRLFIDNGTAPSSVVEVIKAGEQSRLGFEFGLTVELRIKNKFGIETGFRYSKWGAKTKKINITSFEPTPDDLGTAKLKYNNEYLELPLRFNYYLKENINRFFISAGVVPNYNLRNSTRVITIMNDMKTVGKRNDELGDYTKFNAITELGVGMTRKLGEKFEVFVLPNFRIQLRELVPPVPLNRRLFYYGLRLGVKMN